MSFRALALIGLGLLLCGAPALAETRVALVIGNAAYRNSGRLANPANDAKLIGETLRKAGFDVSSYVDLTMLEMNRALREFKDKAQASDVAVVYYAGHGVEINRANFLVPVDAQLQSEQDTVYEALNMKTVLAAVEPAKRFQLVILDACRDNPLTAEKKRTLATRGGNNASGNIGRIDPPSGSNMLIAYAAKEGFQAFDGVTNSPFAESLAKRLVAPGMEVRKAFGYVRDDVLKTTSSQQEPYFYGSLGADDIVLGPPAPAAPVAAPSSPPTADSNVARDYEFAERLGMKEGWDVFIARYPSGFYTEFAKAHRKKLEEVKPTQQVRVEEPRIDPPRPAPTLAIAPETKLPTQVATRPVTAALKPVCTMRTASRTLAANVGGPMTAVALKPNFEGAKALRAIAVAPNGREVASGGDDGLIRIWDLASFRLMRVLKAHTGSVYSLDYWSDSSLLASTGWDGKVKVWSATGDEPVAVFDAVPIGSAAPVAATVKQYGVAFYPQTPLKYLASTGEDGYVRIWDWQKKQLATARLDHKDADNDRNAVRALSYAPNGSGEFVTAGYDGRIRFYHLNGAIEARDVYARKALRIVYSPDGTRIVSAGSDGARPEQDLGLVRLWDVKTQSARALHGHRDYVVSAAWSADSRQIVTGGGGRDRALNLWDAASGQVLAGFSGHESDVEAVAFLPGGTRLISASEDRTIKVWDVATRRVLFTAIGFGDRDYLLYTTEGCYSGSAGVEDRLTMFTGSQYERISPQARRTMFDPDGFAALLAR